MRKFYQVLNSSKDRGVKEGDIICTSSLFFMLKLGNQSTRSKSTSMPVKAINNPNDKENYKEISEDLCLADFLAILQPLAPHLPNGKSFSAYGDIKSEVRERLNKLKRN